MAVLVGFFKSNMESLKLFSIPPKSLYWMSNVQVLWRVLHYLLILQKPGSLLTAECCTFAFCNMLVTNAVSEVDGLLTGKLLLFATNCEEGL